MKVTRDGLKGDDRTLTVEGGHRSFFRFSFFFTGWHVAETGGQMWRQQDETETPRPGRESAAALCRRCSHVHLSMPNKTSLKLLRAPWTFPCLTFCLRRLTPATYKMSRVATRQKKQSETNEHQLFYLFTYVILYLFSFSINQRPSQPPVVY